MKTMLNILLKTFLLGHELTMTSSKDFKGRALLSICYSKWELFDTPKVNLNLLSIFRKVAF